MMLKVGKGTLYSLALVVIGAALSGGIAVAGETGGLSFEQLAAIRSVGDVAFSPDGSLVASQTWENHLVAIPIDGGTRP